MPESGCGQEKLVILFHNFHHDYDTLFSKFRINVLCEKQWTSTLLSFTHFRIVKNLKGQSPDLHRGVEGGGGGGFGWG